MRARALQLLARIQGQEQHYVSLAMADSDPNIRITGLRIARELKLDVLPLIARLSQDPSPQVRRECAIALRHQSSEEAGQLWARLALQYDGTDRWYLEALGLGADGQWDGYLTAWLAAAKGQLNSPAGRDIIWRSRGKQTPALLVKIIRDKSLSAQEREHYFRSLDFITGPEKEAALVELLTTK